MENHHNKVFVFDKVMPSYIRKFVAFAIYFFDLWWYILLVIARLKSNKKKVCKYTFSICAIFKDEDLSLKEWIEFHLLIGVDHFYLYNNFSSDNFEQILQPYISRGVVTLIQWPLKPPCQAPAYQHFYDNFWHETQWVAFIDLDEYICPKYVENIKDWIVKYEDYPSLVVYWKQFGSSGQIKHDYKKLITEQYYVSWEQFYDYGKPIFNTNFEVLSMSSKFIHELPSCVHLGGHTFMIPPINEFKKFVNFRCNRIGLFHTISDFTIQINHYVTKSYEEFFEKKRKRGTATSTGEREKYARSAYAYDFVQSFATSCDFTIQKYVIKLKVKMNNDIPNYFKE